MRHKKNPVKQGIGNRYFSLTVTQSDYKVIVQKTHKP